MPKWTVRDDVELIPALPSPNSAHQSSGRIHTHRSCYSHKSLHFSNHKERTWSFAVVMAMLVP